MSYAVSARSLLRRNTTVAAGGEPGQAPRRSPGRRRGSRSGRSAPACCASRGQEHPAVEDRAAPGVHSSRRSSRPRVAASFRPSPSLIRRSVWPTRSGICVVVLGRAATDRFLQAGVVLASAICSRMLHARPRTHLARSGCRCRSSSPDRTVVVHRRSGLPHRIDEVVPVEASTPKAAGERRRDGRRSHRTRRGQVVRAAGAEVH